MLYFANYIVTDPGETPLLKNQILTDTESVHHLQPFDNAPLLLPGGVAQLGVELLGELL